MPAAGVQPRPVLCFIDDAKFELRNFLENAQQAFERVELMYASSFAEALAALQGREVVGFLLDLYGAGLGDIPTGPPGLGQLEADLKGLVPPDELHRDLEQDSDPANLFLRRLHGQVQIWQNAFARACTGLGQSPAFGFGNFRLAREQYPWAAALAYSRKALYADAAQATQLGFCGVLQKPQGGDEAAIARATREQAPLLAAAVYRAVDHRLGTMAAALALDCRDRDAPLARVMGRAAVQLLAQGIRAPGQDRLQTSRALGRLGLRETGLNRESRGLASTLMAWLSA